MLVRRNDPGVIARAAVLTLVMAGDLAILGVLALYVAGLLGR